MVETFNIVFPNFWSCIWISEQINSTPFVDSKSKINLIPCHLLFFLFSSTKPSHQSSHHRHNLMNSVRSTSKHFFANAFEASANHTNHNKLTQHPDHLPSRWYTVLALPFPDQRLGRRDINTFGRGGPYYQSRAGFFSNPAPPL